MADQENEIIAAARDARARRSAADGDARRWPIATVAGIGIGSAALAAALLYASRSAKKKG